MSNNKGTSQPPTVGSKSKRNAIKLSLAQPKPSTMSTMQADQVNTITGGATAELNYQGTQQSAVGPQLQFDKSQLCMMTPVTVTTQDQGKRTYYNLKSRPEECGLDHSHL
jgi:hypothetical protein